MRVLGIEGTAHTLGVGIVEEERGRPERARILANVRSMVKPAAVPDGKLASGIHPREAAEHHAKVGPDLVEQALRAAGLTSSQLDGIAFSQGPGLGPCLRVAATMARSLSLAAGKPLVGVNHCVAHLEIGRACSDVREPVLLYASGGNTQVIAFVRGRYRVFGETLDIGIGNALDKFARDLGISFPGGPEVERLAAQATGSRLLPLPYTVKGMDLSFSGIALAAHRLASEGNGLPDVCHALQEHAFAALVEVAERALAYTGRDELVLGGGVACNARLQAMAASMCKERGARFFVPPRDVLVDNGAMIAWLGLQRMRAGDGAGGDEIQPYQRTDAVDAPWRREEGRRPASSQGAEAIIERATRGGRSLVIKRRIAKSYRHPQLDNALRESRTRDEAKALLSARHAGIQVPLLFDMDRGASQLILEHVAGPTLREILDEAAAPDLGSLGESLALLHAGGWTHGDPTPANIIVPNPGRFVFLDFGLAEPAQEDEPCAVDLHLIEEALAATRGDAAALFAVVLAGYQRRAGRRGAEVVRRLEALRERGRYK